MKRIIKYKKLNNKGSALITTLVVSLIVTALVLSLILVSYSLFSNVNDKNYDFEARELAESTMAEIDRELTVSYSSAGEFLQAVNNGQNPYYSYVRCNMGTGNWIFYDARVAGHAMTDADVCKYFSVDIKKPGTENGAASGSAEDVIPGTVNVTMYWEKDSMTVADSDSNIEDEYKGIDGATLCVTVNVEYKNAMYSVKREYSLDIIGVSGSFDGNDIYTLNDSFNPGANSIDVSRMWIWSSFSE